MVESCAFCFNLIKNLSTRTNFLIKFNLLIFIHTTLITFFCGLTFHVVYVSWLFQFSNTSAADSAIGTATIAMYRMNKMAWDIGRVRMYIHCGLFVSCDVFKFPHFIRTFIHIQTNSRERIFLSFTF